ncbi:MAG: HAD domain-containing protein [Hydrogenophaga sp.]|uniref:HAD domain-containing protein n=2 Tax=Hydrogenophaga sp. TaxID=1904254 RepID=UPI004037144A
MQARREMQGRSQPVSSQPVAMSNSKTASPRTVSSRPLLFLDLDDVLCLNAPYGGYDVIVEPHPEDLWEKLFTQGAVDTLLAAIEEHRPRVVLTTSWLRMLDRSGFEKVFQATGLRQLSQCFHEHWDAPQNRGETRLAAIERWLLNHHRDEPFVVLDDTLSGTGLAGSRIDLMGCLVLCDVNVGLHTGHVEALRRALQGRWISRRSSSR